MRILFAALAVLALIAGAVLLTRRDPEPEWSTRSTDALSALDQGLDAEMKFYGGEAARLYRAALAADPDFAVAKVFLLRQSTDREERRRLVAELAALGTDELARLTPRERFLVRYALALSGESEESAKELVHEFLHEYPGDPYGLSTCSEQAWGEQDWAQAERNYRDLLRSDPNWVQAQNRLGYIAMARGRFEEAEEHFRRYAFIAPDQANPHDSLGEMLTLVGRYDEARAELRAALEIRPDFCISYQHLLNLAILEGLPEGTSEMLDEAARTCDPELVERLRCEADLWRSYFEGHWEAPWEESWAPCRRRLSRHHPLIHRLAALSGRGPAAFEIETDLAETLERSERLDLADARFLRGTLLHMRGVRAAIAGDHEKAAELLREADGFLVYWGEGQGVMKLYNRLNLAYALERGGDPEASREVLEKVRAVNPEFAAVYPELRYMFG